MASDDDKEPETIFDLHPVDKSGPQPEPEGTPAPQVQIQQPEPQQPEYPTRAVPPLMPLPQPRKEKTEPEPAGPQRYDFFLEDKPKQKKTSPIALPGATSKSPLMRIVVVAVGLVFLLIILGVIMSLFQSGNKTATASLTSILLEQQEIIRLSDKADEHLQTTQMKNFAITTKQSTTSAQQDLRAYLAQRGVKINEKQVAASADPQNDKVLDAAEAADTYDAAFKTTMGQLLTDYQASLKNMEQNVTTIEAKELVTKDIDSVQLLLQMINQQ